MDGIKPTIADLNDDQTPVYDPVKVDLLHPSGPMTTEPSAPEPPHIAPITPPFHATPESNVEIVKNEPAPAPEPEPMPVIPQRIPDNIPAPAPIHDTAPTPPPAAPVVTDPVVSAVPVEKTSHALRTIGLLLLIPIALGIAAYFLYFHKKVVVVAPANTVLTAVAPSKLVQQDTKGPIAAGGTTAVPSFAATLATTAKSGNASLQIEVEPLATAFTGTPTTTGDSVSANGGNLNLTAKPATTLADGAYHWQARTKVGTTTSAWVPESPAGTTTPDFVVSAASAPVVAAAPVNAPAVTAVAGGSVSGLNLTTSQNQPLISGKTDAGTSLTIVVTPDNITLTPKVASDGSWTVTPSQVLANGAHTLALTATNSAGTKAQANYSLSINAVVATTTPPATTTPTTPTTPTPAPAPVNTTTLAPTGDPTQTLSLFAAIIGIISIGGLIFLRRLDRHERG